MFVFGFSLFFRNSGEGEGRWERWAHMKQKDSPIWFAILLVAYLYTCVLVNVMITYNPVVCYSDFGLFSFLVLLWLNVWGKIFRKPTFMHLSWIRFYESVLKTPYWTILYYRHMRSSTQSDLLLRSKQQKHILFFCRHMTCMTCMTCMTWLIQSSS